MNAKKLTSIEAEIVMQDTYDETYSIPAKRMGPESAFQTVLMHDNEDTTKTSVLYASIRQYRMQKVKDFFGLSLLDYMSLPSNVCLKILEECQDAMKSDTEKNTAIMKEITNSTKAK